MSNFSWNVVIFARTCRHSVMWWLLIIEYLNSLVLLWVRVGSQMCTKENDVSNTSFINLVQWVSGCLAGIMTTHLFSGHQ